MSVQDIVSLQISIENPIITRAGFNTALILSSEAVGKFSGKVKSYSSLDELVTDSFSTSGATYRLASKLQGQNPAPSSFKVAKRSDGYADITHEVELTIVPGEEADVYSIAIDGTEYTYARQAGESDNDVATAVNALVTAAPNYVSAVVGSTITLTGNAPGYVGSFDSPSRITLKDITDTSAGLAAADLTAALDYDPGFYGVLSDINSEDQILEIAEWVESRRRVFFAETSDPGSYDQGSSTDVISKLNDLNYANTIVIYSDTPNSGMAAAWLGKGITYEPGDYNFANKTLAGVSVSNLTPAQQSVISGKNGNYYVEVIGSGNTWNGITPSGEFIDVISLVHFLYARITEDVIAALKANVKIPYTNSGIAVITSVIGGRLRSKIGSGISGDPPPTVTAPRVAEINTIEKQQRNVPNIRFTALLDGAINAVQITGTVTVDESVFQGGA